MKSLSFILTTILVISSWASVTPTAPNFLNQLEPLQNDVLVTTPEQDHQPLLDAFAEAKTSIYVGIFGISSPKIAEGLSAAQKRGVKVIVICDKYCTNNPKREEIYNKLKTDGVEMYTATSGFSISHWKMFVVDEKKAFVSTMNFIVRTNQMRDLGVFFTNENIIKEIVAVFKSDVENAKNQTANTPPLTNPNLVWSPNNSEDKLVQLIRSARKTVDIWIENMGSTNVHTALKDVAERGVKVRLLTSECGMGMPPAAAFKNLQDLASSGIKVQVMPFPATADVPYIHAKTINVDDAVLFLGSENFSNNSLLKARELGIIFRDKDIQSRLDALFEKDWAGSIVLPEKAPDTCSPLTVAI
jgi:cardiolipin synthase A/B